MGVFKRRENNTLSMKLFKTEPKIVEAIEEKMLQKQIMLMR